MVKRVFYYFFFRRMKRYGMFKALICGNSEEYNFPFIREKYFLLKISILLLFSSIAGYLLINPPVPEPGTIYLSGDYKIEENADRFGMTRLHRAVIRGNEKIVKLLIKNGMDPDLTDNYGWSSLHWANFLGRDDLSGILIRGGADKNIRTTADWYTFGKGSLPGDLRNHSYSSSDGGFFMQSGQVP